MLKKIYVCVMLAAVVIAAGCVPDNFKFEKELAKAGSSMGEILSATDMEMNSRGELVIADAGNNRIQTMTMDGMPVMQTNGGTKATQKIQSITGISVNSATDDILVCDQRGNKVLVFSPAGDVTARITANVKSPMDVAVSPTGDIYVLMARKSEIYKYSPDGKFISTIGGSGNAALLFPISIRIHKNFIYIADFGSKRVVKLDMDGQFVADFKKKGEYEEMKGPSAISFDENDNMYVLDLGEVPIVLLKPDGTLISKIGDFGSEVGQFLFPTGIVPKNNDEIFILDNSRNTVLNFIKKPQ